MMTTRNAVAGSSKRRSLDVHTPLGLPSRRNVHRMSTPASSHGITPGARTDFNHTPRLSRSQLGLSRRSFNLQSCLDMKLQSEYGSENSSNEEEPPLFVGIIGTSWRIHQVSPLFNLQYHTTRLKQYGKYMRERLSCLSINRMKKVQYKAYFTWFGPENDNFESLQVEVKTTFEDQRTKTSYSGFLLSPIPSAHTSRRFVHLPLLLCTGSSTMLHSVHEILHNLFDCVITPLHIPQSELMWLSAMLNSDQDVKKTKKNDIAKFKYQVSADNANNNVSVLLSCNNLKEIWKAAHVSTSSLVTHEEVKLFHDALYHHLKQTQYVNLYNCKFVMFSLPALTLSYDGSVKMFSKYSAVQTLTFLHSLSNTFENTILSWF